MYECMPTELIVRTSQANMPTSCWGRYGNVAILEIVKGSNPHAITTRSRWVRRIVHYEGKLNIGKTDRAAFNRAEHWAYDYVAERRFVPDMGKGCSDA